MSELEDRLNSILGDPQQMEMIASMAKSLMGAQEAPQAASPPPPRKETGMFESLDPAMLGRLTKAMGGRGSDDKRALLEAMKPYLSPARREKLERAVKLARMIGMAEIAFEALGGAHEKI